MPNWCRNEVKLTGSKDSFTELRTQAVLDFVKETIPNFTRRVDEQSQIMLASMAKKGKEVDEFSKRYKWYMWDADVLTRKDFDFSNIVPYPAEYRQRDEDAHLVNSGRMNVVEFKRKYGVDSISPSGWAKDGYNDGGYNWCIANWGSKWNATDVVWVPQLQTFFFDTAWSPVFPILSALHVRFPELHIQYEYAERGGCFAGGCEYLPEDSWDPSDFYYEEVDSMSAFQAQIKKWQETQESHEWVDGVMKKVPPKRPLTPESSPVWQAGRAYNSWSTDGYFGFKGG